MTKYIVECPLTLNTQAPLRLYLNTQWKRIECYLQMGVLLLEDYLFGWAHNEVTQCVPNMMRLSNCL